ncbi:MAG: tRNA-binding protein [Thermoplasmata archaeon]
MAALTWEDFERVDMRVGEVVEAEEFPEARKPSYRMRIDFGPLGVKKSSAAIKAWYTPDDLMGRRVVAVVNFAPKQIANFLSEVLVLGAIREDQRVVLLRPDEGAALGDRIA